MGLGTKCYITEEWMKMQLDFIYLHKPLTLPENMFAHFSWFLLKRVGTLMRTFQDKPTFNVPMVRFLWFMWANLDPVQRQAIEVNDDTGRFKWWAENVSCHVTELEAMNVPDRRFMYWSTDEYVQHVLNLPVSSIVYPDGEVLDKLREVYQFHPRVAFFNRLSVKWTGDNLDYIKSYLENIKPVVEDSILVIDGLRVPVGQYIWPDMQYNIVSGYFGCGEVNV